MALEASVLHVDASPAGMQDYFEAQEMVKSIRSIRRARGLSSFAAAVVAAAAAFGAAQAQAPAYPAKAVRILVPYSAGGNVDMTARVVARKLAESLGQQRRTSPSGIRSFAKPESRRNETDFTS